MNTPSHLLLRLCTAGLALATVHCASGPDLPPLPPLEPPAGDTLALGHVGEPVAARLRSDDTAISCAPGEPVLVWRLGLDAPVGRTLVALPDDVVDCAADGLDRVIALRDTSPPSVVVVSLESGNEIGRFTAPAGVGVHPVTGASASLVTETGATYQLARGEASWLRVAPGLPPDLSDAPATAVASTEGGGGAAAYQGTLYRWDANGARFVTQPAPEAGDGGDLRFSVCVGGDESLLSVAEGGDVTVWPPGQPLNTWRADAPDSLTGATAASTVLGQAGCGLTWFDALTGTPSAAISSCAEGRASLTTATVEGDRLSALRERLVVADSWRVEPGDDGVTSAILDEDAAPRLTFAPLRDGWIVYTDEGRYVLSDDASADVVPLRVWVGTVSLPSDEAGWAADEERVRRALLD